MNFNLLHIGVAASHWGVATCRLLAIVLLGALAQGALAQRFEFHTRDRHNVLDHDAPAVFLLDSTNQQIDSYPRYAAGVDALYKLIYKYVNYPEEAFLKRLGAKVEARFLIDANGKAKVLEIAREPSEMFRVRVNMAIRNMGRWIPAQREGKPVDMMAEITVLYSVEKGETESVHGFGDLESLRQQLRTGEMDALRPTILFCLPFSYQPYWPEGEEAFQELIANELPYPAKALKNGEEGLVKARFMVGRDGRISQLEVKAEQKAPTLEKAVKAFLKKHQTWHCGASFGIEAESYCYVNFDFRAASQQVWATFVGESKEKSPNLTN